MTKVDMLKAMEANYNSGIRGRRLSALRRASINANNPEFKKMWSDKLYELAEKYDYDAGVKYAEGYKYHPND